MLEEESETYEDGAHQIDTQNFDVYDQAFYQGLGDNDQESFPNDNDIMEETHIHHIGHTRTDIQKNSMSIDPDVSNLKFNGKQSFISEADKKRDYLVCGARLPLANKLHNHLRQAHAKHRSSKPSVRPAKN